MRSANRRFTVVSTVAMAAFMVFVLSSTTFASAAPAPSSGSSQPLWAYGYLNTVSVGPLKTADGWVYEGTATVGYSVVLNQTNTSSTTFELSIERTMGILFFVEFCYPSCTSPQSFANLSYHAWEDSNSFANFTTQGTVTENGVAVPAIALVNTSSNLRANLTERAYSALPPIGVARGALVHRAYYLGAAITSQSTVSFATPLGLIPWNLTGPVTWNSTSAFLASGSASYSYFFHSVGPLLNRTIGPISGDFSISPSGNVTVVGSYSPADFVRFNGVKYPALRLAVEGPFAVREGFILIPSSVDLFGSNSLPWGSDQNGSATISLSYLDAKASVGDHIGIAASSWLYNSAAANPGTTSLSPTSGLSPAAGTSPNPVQSSTVQGTPQSVPQAQSNQNCLITGQGCPAAPGNPNVRGILAEAAVLGVVVVVVAVIAIVLVAERRRVPPPVYPNANLYPPGAAGARPPMTPARAPGSPPPPPAEDDPLDHLW
jgi:hypothetical protein